MNHILQGNYTRAGENFRINIMLHDASTEELIGSDSVEGVGEASIFSMVDELTDRLPDRERYLIQGDFYSDFEKTYDKAIERFEAAVQTKYPILVGYTNLAAYYRRKGWFDRARSVLESWSQNFFPNVSIHRVLATTYREQGKYDLALKELDKAFLLDPTNSTTIRVKGNIYFYQGDLKGAEEEYRKLLQEKEPLNIWGSNRLHFLYRHQGRFKDSKEQLEKSLDLAKKHGQDSWIRGNLIRLAYNNTNPGEFQNALKLLDESWDRAVKDQALSTQRGALWAKGYTYIAMGSLEEAQSIADEYRKMCDEALNKRLIRGYHHLQSRIELARENYTKTIEHIKKAISLWYENSSSRMGLTNLLAFAHYKSGELEQARREYERMSTFHNGRITWGDIYAKSFYMLGKVCEQQGDTTKAVENYEKFLDLWKNADPGLPEVDNARKRLAGLRHI